MRESRVFGARSRTRLSDEIRKKYFLVFEGSKTEPLYFQAVNDARLKLGISPLIELIQIERCRGEEGWSNPRKILDTLSQNPLMSGMGTLTYSTLLNAMMDCIYSDIYIQREEKDTNGIWSILVDQSKNKGLSLDSIVLDREKAIESLLEVFSETSPKIRNVILENLNDSLKNMQIPYDEEIDCICFIFDRDRKSFTEEQYDYVLENCRKTNIKPFPSNPCFEFWLLLHFDEVKTIDQNKLLLNDKISASKSAKSFSFNEFRKLMRQYTTKPVTKSSFDTVILVDRIQTAIENEKSFCEDIAALENQLGSAVGLLLAEFIKK